MVMTVKAGFSSSTSPKVEKTRGYSGAKFAACTFALATSQPAGHGVTPATME
jgi:hypothetical protein